jgi:hypothetical protein
MIQGFAHALINPRDDFDVDPQVLTQPIGRLQLIESLQDPDFPAQQTKAFASLTPYAFHIPATRVYQFKRATKNSLATPQKVGRTTENRGSFSTHVPVLAHSGCDTP